MTNPYDPYELPPGLEAAMKLEAQQRDLERYEAFWRNAEEDVRRSRGVLGDLDAAIYEEHRRDLDRYSALSRAVEAEAHRSRGVLGDLDERARATLDAIERMRQPSIVTASVEAMLAMEQRLGPYLAVQQAAEELSRHANLDRLLGSDAWERTYRLETTALLAAGLERHWSSSTMAVTLAPSAAVSIFGAEQAPAIAREESPATQALLFAGEIAERANEIALAIADVEEGTDPLEDEESTPSGIGLALVTAAQQPVIAYREIYGELVVVGADTPVEQLQTLAQVTAFKEVSALILACRETAIAIHGRDLISGAPDVVRAQIRLATSCIVSESTATDTLSALYVILHEDTDAVFLKAFARPRATGTQWVDLEDVSRVLRNNLGVLHNRTAQGRYTAALERLSQLGITAFPARREEWLAFGDALALVATHYFTVLRDNLALG
jgi:hypothetical protein